MKNILLILALILVFSATSQAQGTDARYSDGVTHGAYAGITSTADSIHYMGRFYLRDRSRMSFDSLAFHITNTDSIRYGVLVKVGGPKHTTDTVRVVTNDGAAGATHYVQKTAAGVTGVPWYLIQNVVGDEAITMQYIDVYLIIYIVGTETAGSTLNGDTVNLLPKAFQ